MAPPGEMRKSSLAARKSLQLRRLRYDKAFRIGDELWQQSPEIRSPKSAPVALRNSLSPGVANGEASRKQMLAGVHAFHRQVHERSAKHVSATRVAHRYQSTEHEVAELVLG